MSRRKRVPQGRALFGEDESDAVVANVLSGVAKVSVSLPDGRTQVVRLHFPSDFIGRPFSTASGPMAEAATDVEMCTFDRRRFEALLREHAGLEELLVRRMTEELDESRDWMLLLGQKTAEERVASMLLMLATRLPPQGCSHMAAEAATTLELPLSRAEIAQFLGLTIETVSRMLKRLSTAGAISVGSGRHIEIRCLPLLEAKAACAAA